MEQERRTNTAVLLKAAHYAAEKHRDQRRLGSRRTPYINHPLDVAERLNRIGGVDDLDVLVAAILHDTIEDTDATESELAQVFGARVAAIVVELTVDQRPHWTDQKKAEIAGASQLSAFAKMIKLSDKTSNVSDTVTNPPRDWTLQRRRDYLEFAQLVANGCRGANPALDAEFDRVLADARARLA